tara:strand:+ start:322 stop:582 length:261 start_codon:yes stop_codon:yes gene_type:complete
MAKSEEQKRKNREKFQAVAKATGVIASGISDALNHVVHKGDQVATGSNVQDTGEPNKDKFNYDPFDEQKTQNAAGQKTKKSKKYYA